MLGRIVMLTKVLGHQRRSIVAAVSHRTFGLPMKTNTPTRQLNRRLANLRFVNTEMVLGQNGALAKVLGQNSGPQPASLFETGPVKPDNNAMHRSTRSRVF